MNNLSERIMFAITVAVAVFIGIFVYLEMESIPKYTEFSPFNEQIDVLDPKEELEITSKNVAVLPPQANQHLTNAVKDLNDQRSASKDDWSDPAKDNGFDGEQAAKDAEKRFKDEAHASAYNQEVKKLIDERNKKLDKEKNTNQNNPGTSPPTEHKVDGQTLVSYDLDGRYPHQNNSWYVRNPGYTCGYGANGTVVIRIKVNKNGNVIAAEYDAAGSKYANECMIEQGLKYAKMSRFDYSSGAPETQSGKIYYSFVSQ